MLRLHVAADMRMPLLRARKEMRSRRHTCLMPRQFMPLMFSPAGGFDAAVFAELGIRFSQLDYATTIRSYLDDRISTSNNINAYPTQATDQAEYMLAFAARCRHAAVATRPLDARHAAPYA